MPKKSIDKDIINKDIIRQNWGKTYAVLPELDLLAVQKTSYELFQQKGIEEIIQEVTPVEDFTGKNWSLTFHEHKIGKATIDPETALIKGLTFNSPLTVTVTLTNKKTGETHNAEVFLGDIPQMTERGTFIINGIERAVVSQLVRSPGVFFTATHDAITGQTLYSAEIRPFMVHGLNLQPLDMEQLLSKLTDAGNFWQQHS